MDKVTERLYKKYRFCTICHLKYGTDRADRYEDGICPICHLKLRGKGSMILRRKYHD